jgi:hypothetical protein
VRSASDLGLSKITYDRIINSLPNVWTDMLNQGPAAPAPKEWFLRDVKMPAEHINRVVSIEDNQVHVERFSVNPDSTFVASEPVVSAVDLNEFDMIRAHVTAHREGLLCHGPQQLLELDPARLILDQRHGNTTKQIKIMQSSVKGSRGVLTAAKSEPIDIAAKWPSIQQMPWKRVLRWVWMAARDRLVNDFVFKFVHRRLPIGERRDWDKELNVGCPCGQELETAEHLFCECTVAKSVWTWLFNAWESAAGQHLDVTCLNAFFGSVPPARLRAKKAYWQLFGIVQGEVLYSIWLERNRWVHDEQPYSAAAIKGRSVARILRAGQACVHLHDVSGFRETFDALFSTLSDSIIS